MGRLSKIGSIALISVVSLVLGSISGVWASPLSFEEDLSEGPTTPLFDLRGFHERVKNFYVEEHENGLAYVAEPLTRSNVDYWKKYVALDQEEEEKYINTMEQARRSSQHDSFIRPKGLFPCFSQGHYAFETAVEPRYYEESMAWVMFIYYGPPERNTAFDDLNMQHIVMTSVVLTDDQSPFCYLTGINRGFHHMNAALQRNPKQDTALHPLIHRGLSPLLFQFAARFIQRRFPIKTHMATVPVSKMRSILEASFPVPEPEEVVTLHHNKDKTHLIFRGADQRALMTFEAEDTADLKALDPYRSRKFTELSESYHLTQVTIYDRVYKEGAVKPFQWIYHTDTFSDLGMMFLPLRNLSALNN